MLFSGKFVDVDYFNYMKVKGHNNNNNIYIQHMSVGFNGFWATKLKLVICKKYKGVFWNWWQECLFHKTILTHVTSSLVYKWKIILESVQYRYGFVNYKQKTILKLNELILFLYSIAYLDILWNYLYRHFSTYQSFEQPKDSLRHSIWYYH
jgi:hypothetical protein